MISRVYYALYQLHRHHLGGWSLIRWAILLCALGGGLTWLHLVPGGRTGAFVWWTGGVLLLLAFFWARRSQFVRFHPHPPVEGDADLPTRGKQAARAAGRMSVGNREQWVIADHGNVERFRNGEFAITAFVAPSRYLGLGSTRWEDEGMWYVFIPPQAMEHTTAGIVYINGRAYTGLRVHYRVEGEQRVVYLAFPAEND